MLECINFAMDNVQSEVKKVALRCSLSPPNALLQASFWRPCRSSVQPTSPFFSYANNINI